MREITKMMITNYQIKKSDFMGYNIKNKRDLSFHHLIVPHHRENLLRIRDLLLYFEKYNVDKFNSRGKKLIKKDYLISRFSMLD